MIQANELRIGNWIADQENVFLRVAGITINNSIAYQHEDGFSLFELPYAEPIPLTPEILEKAGFELGIRKVEDGDIPNLIDLCSVIGKSGSDNIELLFDPFKWYNWPTPEMRYKYSVPIKYVHQLQNLYFALTGTELEIQL